MRHSQRSRPEVNAGSMADIAFLLLIFFLVTATVPKDHGFNRKLPEICKDPPCIAETHERNILQVLLNHKNQIITRYNLQNTNYGNVHCMTFFFISTLYIPIRHIQVQVH